MKESHQTAQNEKIRMTIPEIPIAFPIAFLQMQISFPHMQSFFLTVKSQPAVLILGA